MPWFQDNSPVPGTEYQYETPVPRSTMPVDAPQRFTSPDLSRFTEQRLGVLPPTSGPPPTTAPPVTAGGTAQDPRAFFQSLFPGGTLTPQQLAAQEQALAAQGIRLLGPNAAGNRTKIELPDGSIVDVIGGAGAGHNRNQWLVDRGAGGAIGAGAGSLGGMLSGGGINYGARLPALEKTPGYQFRVDQGVKALDDSAASRGTLLTGGAAKDAIQFGQGLASTEFDNEYRRLFGAAGLGQGAAGQIGQYGSSYAGNATDLITGAGNARAAGTVGSGNAWGNALGNIGNTAMNAYLYNQFGQPSGGATGPWGAGFQIPQTGNI